HPHARRQRLRHVRCWPAAARHDAPGRSGAGYPQADRDPAAAGVHRAGGDPRPGAGRPPRRRGTPVGGWRGETVIEALINMVLLTLMAIVTIGVIRVRSLFAVVILSSIYSFLMASVLIVLDA